MATVLWDNAFAEPVCVTVRMSDEHCFSNNNYFTYFLFKEPVSLFKEPVSLFKECVSLFKEPVALFREPVALFREPVAFFK